MNKDEQKQVAFQAKLLTENPAFDAAFESVKDAYIKKMVDTDPKQSGEREYYHICVNALTDVKNVLTLFLQNGKVIEKDLKKKAKKYR